MLLGQRGGYRKYPCFVFVIGVFVIDVFVIGEKNIKNIPLVSNKKILFPPLLHIKLGLMKQFGKALNKEEEGCKYVCTKSPRLTYEKIKAGIFDGPQIQQLLKDERFISTMKTEELNACKAFSDVVKNFLVIVKSPNFREFVENLSQVFQNLQCIMSVKVYFLHNHLNYFQENFGALSEEQGERFYQDKKVMKKQY